MLLQNIMQSLKYRGCSLAMLAMVAGGISSAFAQEGISVPAPKVDEASSPTSQEVAVLAGGCFWGVQGVFQHVEGVTNAVSGYAGGDPDSARYELVGSGETGHAEAVKVTFDPSKISYGKVLQIFFSVAHDPTQLNRQGPDFGTQYRTAIFPQTEAQAKVAKSYISQLNQARVFRSAIVTKIESGQSFYPAESYHQDYLTLNADQPYIVYNDLPKIENLKKIFAKDFREKPVLTSDSTAPM
jgi:peptide-methionine (S)-S-oxide reductase